MFFVRHVRYIFDERGTSRLGGCIFPATRLPVSPSMSMV